MARVGQNAFGLMGLPRLLGRGLVALYRYTLAPLIGPRLPAKQAFRAAWDRRPKATGKG